MAAQRLFFFSSSSSPRVPKNKKSVFYVFYGTLHPKVECQFEFFSININHEAVSSRKSSVRFTNIKGVSGHRLEKLVKEKKPMAKMLSV
jgi:hypothetical protein